VNKIRSKNHSVLGNLPEELQKMPKLAKIIKIYKKNDDF